MPSIGFLFDAEGRAALARHTRFESVHPNVQSEVANSYELDEIFSADAKSTLREVLPRQQDLICRINAVGARLLIGTDAVIPGYVPGFTPIDEMKMIAAGGVSVFDVLQAATVGAAVSLGIDAERGTVSVGKRASLILLDGNPMKDLEHLSSLIGCAPWWTTADVNGHRDYAG